MSGQPMKFGIFMAPFHRVGDNPTLAMQRDLELIQWLDYLGYDEAWIGEHHSAGWEIIASPELMIAAAAERTKHIMLGTGVTSLPYHHPLLVADRMVQLDHMTRGRAMLGVGPGALTSDAYMMGIEPTTQRPRMEEALDAIIALLSGETVNMKTDWFELRDASLQLLPYTRPCFPIAVASVLSPAGMLAAGKHGLGVLSIGASVTGEVDGIRKHWALAEEAAANNGKTMDRAEWRLVKSLHLAETREQAYRDVEIGVDLRHVHLRLLEPAGIVPVHRLPAGELVEHPHAGLARAVTGFAVAAEREVRLGAGAYICGEETAMLESLEGKRGMVRFKPPVPAISGLFGRPSVINNVVTLASVPIILERGGAFYKDFGLGRSRGTVPIQLAGNVKRPGLIEKAFGVTLREIIYEYGGGTASGRPLRAVQVGGPLGAYFPESLLDLPFDYEAIAAHGGILGHGGIVVFDDTVDLARQARYAMEFCALESCGKCTPCRIGSTRGLEVIDRMLAARDEEKAAELELLRDLCDTTTAGCLCALGGLTPLPVVSALKYFPQDFGLEADKT